MIRTTEELDKHISKEDAVMLYFSHESCNVCKVLKPKVVSLLEEEFPKIKMIYIDTVKYPEIPAQKSIFAVPSINVYFAGREYFRWSRNISIQQIRKELSRPYQMMFG